MRDRSGRGDLDWSGMWTRWERPEDGSCGWRDAMGGLLGRRPLVVRRFIGSLGEGRGRRRCRIAVGMKIVNEDQNRGVTIGSTRTRARVTLDHAL